MKIIQVIPAFRLAGAETMCENLCIALRNAGQTVIAVSLYSEQTSITNRLSKNGVRIVFLGKKPGFDPTVFVKLVTLFKKEKPDVVHTHIYASKYALPAAVVARVKKRVHTVHNMAQKEQGNIGKKINAYMYKYCGVIPVALSQEVKKSIHSVYNLSDDVIPIIYNGIDLGKCLPKTTYQINKHCTILHIGRFMDVKNHETLIHAFAKLTTKYDDLKLQMIGEGELQQSMKKLVKQLSLSDKVEFLGMQSNVYPYLHEADIFCLPSKYEGLPMTLIEAMGTGLPIIASNVGGIPDMLKDNQNALLIQPDEDEIAEALEILYSDMNLRKELGIAAKEYSHVFSDNIMASEYIKVYEK